MFFLAINIFAPKKMAILAIHFVSPATQPTVSPSDGPVDGGQLGGENGKCFTKRQTDKSKESSLKFPTTSLDNQLTYCILSSSIIVHNQMLKKHHTSIQFKKQTNIHSKHNAAKTRPTHTHGSSMEGVALSIYSNVCWHLTFVGQLAKTIIYPLSRRHSSVETCPNFQVSKSHLGCEHLNHFPHFPCFFLFWRLPATESTRMEKSRLPDLLDYHLPIRHPPLHLKKRWTLLKHGTL